MVMAIRNFSEEVDFPRRQKFRGGLLDSLNERQAKYVRESLLSNYGAFSVNFQGDGAHKKLPLCNIHDGIAYLLIYELNYFYF